MRVINSLTGQTEVIPTTTEAHIEVIEVVAATVLSETEVLAMVIAKTMEIMSKTEEVETTEKLKEDTHDMLIELTEGIEITEVTGLIEVTKVIDQIEVTDQIDLTEETGLTEVIEITEVTEVTGQIEVTKVIDQTEVTDLTEVIEVADLIDSVVEEDVANQAVVEVAATVATLVDPVLTLTMFLNRTLWSSKTLTMSFCVC